MLAAGLYWARTTQHWHYKTVVWNTVPLEAKGNGDLLTHVRVKDVKTGEERDLPANGLFYAIGAPYYLRSPQTGHAFASD